MHLHRGRIGVMSAGEGQGTTFCIDIPIVVFDDDFNVALDSVGSNFTPQPSTDTEQTDGAVLHNTVSMASIAIPDSSNGPNNDVPLIQSSASMRDPLSPRGSASSLVRSPRTSQQSLLPPRSPSMNSSHLMSISTGQYASRALLPPLVEPSFTTVRVLIVDDAASNRKMVRRLFQTMFHHLDDAENGRVAVEKYAQSVAAYRTDMTQTPIGVVLMDYLMPVMDGIEATRQIKQVAQDQGVDVLVFGVTGQGLSEDVRIFKAAGADEVFMKPLDFNKLLSCLQTTYQFST